MLAEDRAIPVRRSGRVGIDPEEREVVADPGDGLVQHLVERVSRRPAPELARQGSPREEPADLAGRGPDPFGVGLDADRPAEAIREPLDQGADRDVLALADVDGAAQRRSQPAIATKPATVSLTYVRSRRGSRLPRRTTGRVSAWLIIVGMIARADCLGPKVLKGRRIVTGRPKAR